MKGVQKKIMKVIADSLGCESDIQPQRLRSMGYNIIKVSHVQNPPPRNPSGFQVIYNSPRKPTVKDALLVEIGTTMHSEGRDFVHSRYWVEIPKDMVTRILALNHFPDLK